MRLTTTAEKGKGPFWEPFQLASLDSGCDQLALADAPEAATPPE